jgi:autotransporter-associated beta strand protein
LGATVSPSSIIVNNSTKAYTFADPNGSFTIAGSGRLMKLGSNKLTIADLQNTSYSGIVNVEAGSLQLGDGTYNATLGTGPVTNNAVIILDCGGWQQPGLNLGLGAAINNSIHGTGSVVQVNTNFLSLPTSLGGPASTFTGGVTVKPDTTLGHNSGNAAGIGGGVAVDHGRLSFGATANLNIGLVQVTNGIILTSGDRNCFAQFAMTNSTITFEKGNRFDVISEMNTLVGTITNRGTGLLRFNNGGANLAYGSSNALWVLDTVDGYVQPRNSSVNYMGGLHGVGAIGGNSSGGGNNTVEWVIGGLNLNTVYSGTINDFGRNVNITKVGTGTWGLSNAVMTFRGTTRVNSGTMAFQGSTLPVMCTNITVAAPGVLNVTLRDDGTLSLGTGTTNQHLMGDGTITGNVTLGASGRLEPGFSIGTLTVSGTANLGGVTTMELDGSSTSSDRLVGGTINYGGTLVLTNSGGPVSGTRVYTLFQGSIGASQFSSVVTQAIAGVSWDVSQLNANGTVTLVGAAVNPNPTNIVATVSGNQLTLDWPDSHAGWILETNAVGITASASWFPWPGSESMSQLVLDLDTTKTNVFFRLRRP